jgi:putative DNA primase/helicase
MTKDTIIEIAVAFTAQAKTWKNKKMSWSEFLAKLRQTIVKDLTFKQFKQLAKKDASKIKDVGGYVGGYLRSGKRSPSNVSYRQLITLDIDYGTPDFWEAFTFVYDCEAVLHGTMSSSPDAPRYRLILPLSRECSAEEYTAVSRKVAGNIGIEFFDNSTFEVNRLMYWPSVCSDVTPYLQHQQGDWLDVDGVLASYRDWRDVSEWPTNRQASDDVKAKADKQEDPLEKRGVVGAFCRTYSIEEAIETFLEKVYEPGSEDRYTYLNGSTANGLVTYDGKFAYSHHGTDLAGGMLCNAFDLVRLHKFGELDQAPNSLKSFKAMEAFALQDKAVKSLLAKELKESFAQDFEDESGASWAGSEAATDWLGEMDMDGRGQVYLATAKNIDLILTNDLPLIKLFALNQFDNKAYLMRSAPWRKVREPEPIRDVDLAGLRNYIEKAYGISSKEKVADSFKLEILKSAFHPIRDYLNGLIWDQEARLDTLFIDYFGIQDTPYAREAARKSLCGAVARVFEPGVKFDLVPVLVGEEGIYKSTFWKRLGGKWFSDTFFKVEGKEGLEQIQGAWIIEIAELAGLRKSDAESVKHFLTKQIDQFRAAYAHVSETHARQCIFVGTTNIRDFLKDPTGNRRFLPIMAEPSRVTKNVDTDLVGDEVNQIWAEAVFRYMQGEKLYLSPLAASEAKSTQADHMELDERLGFVEAYLSKLLPEDWSKMDTFDRQAFIADAKAVGTIARTEVSVAEVWVECLGKKREDITKYNTRDVNDILKILGWQFNGSVRAVQHYGRQRIFYKPKP